MFSSKDVPAVGVSIGIERIFNLLEDKVTADCRDESGAVTGKIKETATQVIASCLVSSQSAVPPKKKRRDSTFQHLFHEKQKVTPGYPNAVPYASLLSYSLTCLACDASNKPQMTLHFLLVTHVLPAVMLTSWIALLQ